MSDYGPKGKKKGKRPDEYPVGQIVRMAFSALITTIIIRLFCGSFVEWASHGTKLSSRGTELLELVDFLVTMTILCSFAICISHGIYLLMKRLETVDFSNYELGPILVRKDSYRSSCEGGGGR